MTEAYVFDALRTPRGKGKKEGTLHEVKPIDLLVGLLTELQARHRFDTAAVDDVVMGIVSPVGEQGSVLPKVAALKAEVEQMRAASAAPVATSKPAPAVNAEPVPALAATTAPAGAGADSGYALGANTTLWGYGQLDYRLRSDSRVVVMERTNARTITKEMFPDKVSFVSSDLSFISFTKVYPAIASVFGAVEGVAAAVDVMSMPRVLAIMAW